MLSKLSHLIRVPYVLGLIAVLVALSACRNKDGEKAFVDAIDIIELGVQSIQVQAGDQGLTLESGSQSQFTALATLEDSSTLDVSDRVTWSSGSAGLFSVDGSGLVTAGAMDGTADLSIAWGDFSNAASVSVSTAELNSISFSNFPVSVSECLAGTQLSVTGTYADRSSDITALVSTWASGTESVAKVSAAGLVDTFTSGASNLTASYKGKTTSAQSLVVSDSVQALALTPNADFDLDADATKAFTVTATESGQGRDVSSIATYDSSDTSALTIASTGLATAGSSVGSSQVKASCGGLDTNIVTVTIVEPATATSLIIRYNGSDSDPAGPFDVSDSPVQLQAFLRYSNSTEQNVTTSEHIEWSVSATVSGTSATVRNSGSDNGEVRFNANGRTEIKAVYDDTDIYFEDSLDVLVE